MYVVSNLVLLMFVFLIVKGNGKTSINRGRTLKLNPHSVSFPNYDEEYSNPVMDYDQYTTYIPGDQEQDRYRVRSESDHQSAANNATPSRQESAAIQDLEDQEKEAQGLFKVAAAFEIAQGALEITLGAVRIATAATSGDVLRREDKIQMSRSSLHVTGEANTPSPTDILGGPLKDEVLNGKGNRTCNISTPLSPNRLNDPFSVWSQGFKYRMKHSAAYSTPDPMPPLTSTFPHPNPSLIMSSTLNLPDVDDSDRILKLLGNMLDTNNQVLRLLGIKLSPITSSGSILLHKYKERIESWRRMRLQYAMDGYMDDRLVAEQFGMESNKSQLNWFTKKMEREMSIRAMTDEIVRLKRSRKVNNEFSKMCYEYE